jgi:predicted RNA binding protein YcfA (HicA-like mRNA interferase family)
MKVREIVDRVQADGWRLVQPEVAMGNSSKPSPVTLVSKPSHDLKPGTPNSILRPAGLKETG